MEGMLFFRCENIEETLYFRCADIEFRKKHSNTVDEAIVLSQKDVKTEQGLRFIPVYMAPFLAGQKE